jgi:hypothetical protein
MREKKMIKLKYSEFLGSNFNYAMRRLTSTQLPQKVAYQLMKITNEIGREQKKAQELYRTSITDKFAMKDETGKIVQDGDAPDSFKVAPEMQAEFKAAQEAFGEMEAMIDRHPIPMGDLGTMTFAAAELAALAPLLAESTENVVALQPTAS